MKNYYIQISLLSDGHYRMTDSWSLKLDQPHNRRLEEGSLVIWRPGFTLWINVLNNEDEENIEERLNWIKKEASHDAFDHSETTSQSSSFFMYRLAEQYDGKTVNSLNGYILSPTGHVQISAYFDDESELNRAKTILRSVMYE